MNDKLNIQDEVQKIHAKYGTTEKANYEIQLLFDRQNTRHSDPDDAAKISEQQAMTLIDMAKRGVDKMWREKIRSAISSYEVSSMWESRYKQQALESLISDTEPKSPDAEQKRYFGSAWECPRCHKVNAFWKTSCDCPPKMISNTTDQSNPLSK